MSNPWDFVPSDVYEDSNRAEQSEQWLVDQRRKLSQQWLEGWMRQAEDAMRPFQEALGGLGGMIGGAGEAYQEFADLDPTEQRARVVQRLVGDPLGRVGEAVLDIPAVESERALGDIMQWSADRGMMTDVAPGTNLRESPDSPVYGAPREGETLLTGAGWEDVVKRHRGLQETNPELVEAGLVSSPINFAGEVLGAAKGAVGGAGLAFGGLKKVGKVAKGAERAAEATRPTTRASEALSEIDARIAASSDPIEISVLREQRSKITGEAIPPEPPRPPAPPEQPPTGGMPPDEPAKFAGNIRLSKYVDEDVQDVIQRTHDANPAAFEEARRGVVPDDAVRLMARETGAKVDDLIKHWKPGNAENAETIFAVRGALKAKTQEVAALARTIRAGDDSTATLVKLQQAMKEQDRVQKVAAGLTAESGRSLRQFTMDVDDIVLSGDDEKIRKLLEKLGGRERTEELAGALAKIDPNDQQAMFDFLRNAQRPDLHDYLLELWYNSILSAPPTHIINFASNAFMTAKEPIGRGVAAAVELPLSALQGRPRERFFGEVGAAAYGIGQSLMEGARRWLYIMKNGYSFDDVVRLDLRKTQAFKGKLGTVINIPTRELAASDALFRAVNYSAALHGNAYRMAAREGLKGEALGQRVADLIANPPASLMEQAGKISKYNVFQSEPGKFTQAVLAFRNAEVVLPLLGKTQPVRFSLPFINTPANILKRSLEHSPLGALNPKMWQALAKSDPEVADHASRILQGSIVAGAIGAMVGQDIVDIVGEAPSSAAAKDRFYRDGKLPHSIRFGPKGNPYRNYQKWEPLNIALAQVAAVVDAIRYGEKNTVAVGEMASRAVQTIGRNFVSQTYMTGLADTLDAMSDWDRYGGQFLERLATGFIFPSGALRTAARAVDTTVREPANLVEAAMAQIPGLSKKVPAKQTALGEDVQRATPFWSPFQVGSRDESPLARELSRLEMDVGFVGDSIEGVKLSREEKYQYQRIAGELLRDLLPDLMSLPEYKVVDDKDKADALQRARARIGVVARRLMMNRMGDSFIDRYVLANRR